MASTFNPWSSPQQYPGATRLSLTAHYHPYNLNVVKGKFSLVRSSGKVKIFRVISRKFLRRTRKIPITSESLYC